ncbi:glycosyltransferase family 39 protein [Hymenobacter psychrotolerans]|nr:glycosyltransferase family 39 protein [Hymenobacter psychrotolerans]
MRSWYAALAQNPTRCWLALLLLGLAAAFGLDLNSWGPLESSEARYAEIGREMLASGDWLHPRLLGILHYHKPPLTYWLTAAGLSVTGSSAAGVRLLPGLAALGQILLVYKLGRVLFYGDARRALTAAVVYATLPVVWVAALNVTTDGYLATWELAAAYGIVHHYHRHSWWGLYVFWLGLGLALLTKGPVGLVLPLMAVAGYYFRQGRTRRPFTIHHAVGLGLLVAVGLSWYGALALENPAMVRYFLVGHTVERFASAEAFGRTKPWWFYLVLAPATSLPWSALLLGRAGRVGWAALPRPWQNVLLFWVLVPLLFFSLSQSKLLLYVLPVFAGVALLTAYHLHEMPAVLQPRWGTGLLTFWGALLLGVMLLPAVAGTLRLVVPPLVPAVAGLGLLGLLTVRWWVQGAARPLAGAAGFMLTLLLVVKPLLAANELAFQGTRPVAQALARSELKGRPVVVYNELLPSLAFALGRVPVSLYAGNLNVRRETQFEANARWRATWLDVSGPPPPALDSLLRQRAVLLIKRDEPRPAWLPEWLSRHRDVGSWRIYYAP